MEDESRPKGAVLVDRHGRVIRRLDERLDRIADEGVTRMWRVTIKADELPDDDGMKIMFEWLPERTGVDIEIVYG